MPASNEKAVDVSCEGNALSFALRNLIGGYSFIDIVRVEEVTGLTLTVMPLLRGVTMDDKIIANEPIFDVPYLQLRRGNSAVIMDPEVGDIGLIAICDKDTTNIKRTKADSAPDSYRSHSLSDSVYLTGIASLNDAPTQYVHLHHDGIDIVSPLKVSVKSPAIELNGEISVSLNAPNITLNGAVTQGDGSYKGGATFKNGARTPEDFVAGEISLKTHKTPNIQRGSETSDAPVA